MLIAKSCFISKLTSLWHMAQSWSLQIPISPVLSLRSDRVSTSKSGVLGSNLGFVVPNTLKMILVAFFCCAQNGEVHKGGMTDWLSVSIMWLSGVSGIYDDTAALWLYGLVSPTRRLKSTHLMTPHNHMTGQTLSAQPSAFWYYLLYGNVVCSVCFCLLRWPYVCQYVIWVKFLGWQTWAVIKLLSSCETYQQNLSFTQDI